MPYHVDTVENLGNGFIIETGSRNETGGWEPNAKHRPTGPCIWIIRERGHKEVARVDRCWATGNLLFHFEGGAFNDAEEFNGYVDALNKLRERAKTLPPNPKHKDNLVR